MIIILMLVSFFFGTMFGILLAALMSANGRDDDEY